MHSERVLPFYVVCDESVSMTEHIDTVNQGLRELHRAVAADPAVADRTRFCLIGFSGSANILLPMCRLADLAEMTGLTARAETNFGAAFALLRDTITRDVAALELEFRRVYRPAVFFLSDGQPTDPATWPKAFGELTDPAWPARPKMIAFGMGDADPVTIGRIGTFRAFVAQDGVSPGSALHEFARALTASIVSSGHPAALRVPERISGFTALPAGRR
jgi:uncharacterized protein YegL